MISIVHTSAPKSPSHHSSSPVEWPANYDDPFLKDIFDHPGDYGALQLVPLIKLLESYRLIDDALEHTREQAVKAVVCKIQAAVLESLARHPSNDGDGDSVVAETEDIPGNGVSEQIPVDEPGADANTTVPTYPTTTAAPLPPCPPTTGAYQAHPPVDVAQPTSHGNHCWFGPIQQNINVWNNYHGTAAPAPSTPATITTTSPSQNAALLGVPQQIGTSQLIGAHAQPNAHQQQYDLQQRYFQQFAATTPSQFLSDQPLSNFVDTNLAPAGFWNTETSTAFPQGVLRGGAGFPGGYFSWQPFVPVVGFENGRAHP
ncbi:hypothetical protein Z517_09206 [Fonsecaea pedrosoi CBS 271.37]|uniref:Uncharacterized protein n=1 Tax=Fonsecaea pedrosoi CBS 271.37 TaxID=1442368 RepID=A0A0D2ER74_9EURO|nr:uncharacterized protein Z517_09206 [Fonsecaea pedrosoi CBS 271.37]KIW76762.1 hypothetical protein Z517_09206 [Fonsecaea pedrosoi CBS 271.37]